MLLTSTVLTAALTLSTLVSSASLPSVPSNSTLPTKRKNVNRPNPASLDHCPGHAIGDADTCTFEATGSTTQTRIDHIIGDPVDNCMGGTDAIKSSVGGTTTVSQSWFYGVTEGFSASGSEEGVDFGVSFSNSDTWTTTNTQSFTQNIQTTIQPGFRVRRPLPSLLFSLTHTLIGRLSRKSPNEHPHRPHSTQLRRPLRHRRRWLPLHLVR